MIASSAQPFIASISSNVHFFDQVKRIQKDFSPLIKKVMKVALVAIVSCAISQPIVAALSLGFFAKFCTYWVLSTVVSAIASRILNKCTTPDLKKLFPKTPSDSVGSVKQIKNIEEVEKRARPGELSKFGFLGAKESLEEVLKEDAETVRRMGTTHEELAKHLESILKEAEEQPGERKILGLSLALYSAKEVDSQMQLAHGNKKHALLVISQNKTEEDPQKDLFGTDFTWNGQFVVQNLATGVSLTLTRGTIRYIREYGFYQGKGTSYRVDPIKIMTLLTGIEETYLKARFGKKSAPLLPCFNKK